MQMLTILRKLEFRKPVQLFIQLLSCFPKIEEIGEKAANQFGISVWQSFLDYADGLPHQDETSLNKLVLLCLGDSAVSVHLNFSVVSANSANTSEAIQKRTITFDSDQPSSSKWW